MIINHFLQVTEKYLIVSLRNHLNNGQFSATDLYFVQMCGSSLKSQFDDPLFRGTIVTKAPLRVQFLPAFGGEGVGKE